MLTVTEGNAPAMALYARCGFRPFGVEPMAVTTPDGYRAKVHMWLPLDGTEAATDAGASMDGPTNAPMNASTDAPTDAPTDAA